MAPPRHPLSVINARPLPPPPGWCERCDADVSEEASSHYHCVVCGARTSMMGHRDGCPVPRTVSPNHEVKESMISTRVQSVTTTVVRRSMKTPVHWNEVMKVTTLVMNELNAKRGRQADATPFDDEIWFEPGPDDDEISICYQLSQTRDDKS